MQSPAKNNAVWAKNNALWAINNAVWDPNNAKLTQNNANLRPKFPLPVTVGPLGMRGRRSDFGIGRVAKATWEIRD